MRRLLAGIALAIAVATALAYAPVLGNGFTNFDDDAYVTDNVMVRDGMTVAGLRWAWTAFHASNWHPLTWMSHMLDCRLFGLEPAGHHATSLLLHMASAVLLFLTLQRMTGAPGRSGIVAALFALHPLHVESVAWIAERKDVLSGLFWMLSLLAYARYAEQPSRGRFAVVVVAHALGLASKPMVLTLPAVLLLLDFWPLRRSERLGRLVLEKVPFLLLSAASAVVTLLAQRAGRAVGSLEAYPLAARLGNAAHSVIAYLAKMVWPTDLAVFYPHPGLDLPGWKTWGAALVVLAISCIAFRLRTRAPYLIVGWAWYLATLFPVLGLVQVGEQGMADRYTYLPSIGIFLAAVWGAMDLLGARARRQRRGAVVRVATGAALVMVAGLGILTHAQAQIWRSSLTLFEHAIAVTRDNDTAHLQLGIALGSEERNQEAIGHFEEALRIRPRDPMTNYNLAVVLEAVGRRDEAQRHYLAAVDLRPRQAGSHINLGRALAQEGRYEEAIGHFAEAVRIEPGLASAHYNWGTALAARQRWDEAIVRFRRAVELQPSYPEAHHNLGAALYFAGDYPAAWREVRIAESQGYAPHPELLRQLQAKAPEAPL